MLAMTHALVGATIAQTVPTPITGVLLVFTSHFIIDCIPHWDVGTNWRKRAKATTGILAIADTITAIVLTFLLFREKIATGYLIAAIIASVIPDWMETPWYIFFAKRNKQKPAKSAGFLEKAAFHIYKLENKFHTKTTFPLGFITQLATLAFFLLLLR